jgi:hypothetical protein
MVVALLLTFTSAVSAQAPSFGSPQTVSLGLERIFATDNPALGLDGVDDTRVDVDVAVLDSGVDLENTDINLVERTNCEGAVHPTYLCTSASPSDGDDGVIFHGTKSAMSIAAIDNGIGGVGAAAGARIWAVDVTAEDELWQVVNGQPAMVGDPVWDLERVIAGVKWVTAHADEIEVAYLAATCAPEQVGAGPQPRCSTGPGGGVDLVDELEEAVEESIAAGVVYVTGSSNFDSDISTVVPQRFDDMLVASPMADSDGEPGGLGPDICGTDDDTSWGGNWGAGVDVAAPGCAASAAAPHLGAAAAILASRDNPDSVIDVRAIGESIFGTTGCDPTSPTVEDVGAANCEWTDLSGDGVKEPLLDLGDQELFAPSMMAWQTVQVSSGGAVCGVGVTCQVDDSPWVVRVEYVDGGALVGQWNCDIDFDAVVDGDGSVDIDSATWSGSGPGGSVCYQGVSDPYQLGNFPAEGRICQNIQSGEYALRLPISIDRDGQPTAWYDGSVYSGAIFESDGTTFGFRFGHVLGQTAQYSWVGFPTTPFRWMLGGEVLVTDPVDLEPTANPCPWPELQA